MSNYEIYGGSREQANQWLAELSPYLLRSDMVAPKDVRTAIDKINALRLSGPPIITTLEMSPEGHDQELVLTMKQALEQLPAMETAFRQQLGVISPGDPQGRVNLDLLQERLAEQKARVEVGLPLGDGTKFNLLSPQKAAAVPMLAMGLGVGAFITFHATLMIGGMYRAFGPLAFGMLAFYSIFGFAVWGMLKGGLGMLGTTTLELLGDEIVVRSTGPLKGEKRYSINRNSRFEVNDAPISGNRTYVRGAMMRGQALQMGRQLQFRDAKGEIVSLPSNALPGELERLAETLNQRVQLLPY